MFTVVCGSFRLSKAGKFGGEFLESVNEDVKKIALHTYNNGNHNFDCDDLIFTSVEEVEYDTCEESVILDGFTYCYQLNGDRDLENCDIVKLNNTYYRVLKYKDDALLNNETLNEIEYECKLQNLEMFLESLDENYKLYTKVRFNL